MPTRVFTALLILMGLVLVLLVVARGYGSARITDFLNPGQRQPESGRIAAHPG